MAREPVGEEIAHSGFSQSRISGCRRLSTTPWSQSAYLTSKSEILYFSRQFPTNGPLSRVHLVYRQYEPKLSRPIPAHAADKSSSQKQVMWRAASPRKFFGSPLKGNNAGIHSTMVWLQYPAMRLFCVIYSALPVWAPSSHSHSRYYKLDKIVYSLLEWQNSSRSQLASKDLIFSAMAPVLATPLAYKYTEGSPSYYCIFG